MDEELRARLAEFKKDTLNLAEHAAEAMKHAEVGDLQGAAQVTAVSHYRIRQVSDERDGILQFLRNQGITPNG